LPPLSEGWYFIKVKLTPALYFLAHGLYSSPIEQTQSFHFKVINTAGLSVLSPQNQTYDSDEVPFVFGVNEPSAHVSYSLDNQTNLSVQENTTLESLTDGSHSLVVYSEDDSGTVVDSVAVTFSVNNPQTEAPSPNVWIAIPAVMIAVGVLGLVYFRKRRV
jgi:hypothetical protein